MLMPLLLVVIFGNYFNYLVVRSTYMRCLVGLPKKQIQKLSFVFGQSDAYLAHPCVYIYAWYPKRDYKHIHTKKALVYTTSKCLMHFDLHANCMTLCDNVWISMNFVVVGSHGTSRYYIDVASYSFGGRSQKVVQLGGKLVIHLVSRIMTITG
jgi:hypothetical protein